MRRRATVALIVVLFIGANRMSLSYAQSCTADDCPYDTGSVEGQITARTYAGQSYSLRGVRIQIWTLDGDPLWAHSVTETRVGDQNTFRFGHVETGSLFWLELPDINGVGGPCEVGKAFSISANYITTINFVCRG